MKRTKIFAGFAALVFTAGLGFVSCSNDDDDVDSTVEKSEADVELENSAFSVLRSLANLAEYDENGSLDEDGIYTGVETLPSNWKSIKFTCDQGYELGDDSSVRSIAVSSTDDARAFFSDMIGETVTDDSCTWTCPGFGTLTYTEVSGNDDLYATVDVAIDVLPSVTKLNFVPVEVITSENAENSFSGVPYYHAGDVIRRKSDETYWICVRPAGGPLRKDKSYWICFNPYDKKGKCLITGETKKVTVNGEKATWKYAKNLMSLKTAEAASFTFLCIANPKTNKIFDGCEQTNTNLKNIGFDLLQLSCGGRLESGDVDEYTLENMGVFAFAYGKPKNDSKRPRSSEVKYVQPYLSIGGGSAGSEKACNAEIRIAKNAVDEELWLSSVTDRHDLAYVEAEGLVDDESPYNYEDYLFEYLPNNIKFANIKKLVGINNPFAAAMTIELCINDNKGKTEAKKPSSAYEDVFVATDSGSQFDYWAARQNTMLIVDGKEVSWQNE